MCCDGLGNTYFHYENEVNIHRRKVPMQMSAVLNVANYYLFFEAFKSWISFKVY